MIHNDCRLTHVKSSNQNVIHQKYLVYIKTIHFFKDLKYKICTINNKQKYKYL